MPKILTHIIAYLTAPLAAIWVGHHEVIIRVKGRPLTPEELEYCRSIKIKNTQKIRILSVPRVPSPVPKWLQNLCQKFNFPVGNAAGMCMCYGIYIDQAYDKSSSLIRHELVHTTQYENLGSIRKFLQPYLQQCLQVGYENAPLEIEARNLS